MMTIGTNQILYTLEIKNIFSKYSGDINRELEQYNNNFDNEGKMGLFSDKILEQAIPVKHFIQNNFEDVDTFMIFFQNFKSLHESYQKDVDISYADYEKIALNHTQELHALAKKYSLIDISPITNLFIGINTSMSSKIVLTLLESLNDFEILEVLVQKCRQIVKNSVEAVK